MRRVGLELDVLAHSEHGSLSLATARCLLSFVACSWQPPPPINFVIFLKVAMYGAKALSSVAKGEL